MEAPTAMQSVGLLLPPPSFLPLEISAGIRGATAKPEASPRTTQSRIADRRTTLQGGLKVDPRFNNFIPFSPPYNQFMYSVKNMAGPRM